MKAEEPRALKASELEKHPEFPYLTWDLKPSKKAKLPVAASRGGPLNLAYEVHGNGPRKLIVSYFKVARRSSRTPRTFVRPR